MDTALYTTIWIALLGFVIGEAGRRRRDRNRPVRWAWWTSASGAALLVAHMLIVFATRHGWSHDAAVRETARQTAAVYGLDWGGGIYANYVFAAAWIFDLWRWRPGAPRTPRSRARPGVTWTLRVIFFIVMVNAAVVFVPMPRRIAGILVVLALLWLWRPAARADTGLDRAVAP